MRNAVMSDFRKERIEKLLTELRYEVERGVMQGEIDETITFRFYVPLSRTIPDGVVFCRFETRPTHRCYVFGEDLQPRLKVVK
jgi:hypothetical protein